MGKVTIAAAWLPPLLLLTGSAIATAQREPDPIELSDEDDGRVYRVPVGAEFEVHLRGAVDDGYEWVMRDDPRFIAVEPPSTQGYGRRRGDRQDRTFTVRVTQPGRAPLMFEHVATCCGYKRNVARRVSFIVDAVGSSPRASPERLRDPRPGGGSDPGAPPVLPPLREADAGRTIRLPAGREIVILLPFASRLDQRWQVIASRNIGLAAPIAEQRDPARKPNVFRLDSNDVIRLRPGGPGEAEVTFGYLPLEHGSTRMRQLRYRFVID